MFKSLFWRDQTLQIGKIERLSIFEYNWELLLSELFFQYGHPLRFHQQVYKNESEACLAEFLSQILFSIVSV